MTKTQTMKSAAKEMTMFCIVTSHNYINLILKVCFSHSILSKWAFDWDCDFSPSCPQPYNCFSHPLLNNQKKRRINSEIRSCSEATPKFIQGKIPPADNLEPSQPCQVSPVCTQTLLALHSTHRLRAKRGDMESRLVSHAVQVPHCWVTESQNF